MKSAELASARRGICISKNPNEKSEEPDYEDGNKENAGGTEPGAFEQLK